MRKEILGKRLALIGLATLWSAPSLAAVFDIPDGDVAALVAAIEEANANQEPNVINLAVNGLYRPNQLFDNSPDCSGSTLPAIRGRLIIAGSGSRIEGTRDWHRPICVTEEGHLTLQDTHLRDFVNEGPLEGLFTEGGVMVNHGRLHLERVTISDALAGASRASSKGGAILNRTTGQLTLVNVTIIDIVTDGPGAGGEGAVFNQGGEIRIVNSLITGNSGNTGGITNFGRVTLVNSIVAGNEGRDCTAGDDDEFVSAGHNIDGDGTCGLDQPTDLPSTDPRFGAFADHGGLVPTVALESDSPAIDAADRSQCSPVDARGFVRADSPNFACDIGAFERGARTHAIEPALTASWFFLPQDGHGFNIEVLGPDRDEVLAYWYTYDAEGNPLWLLGVGPIEGHRAPMVMHAFRGMRFGEFDPATNESAPWGTLTLYFGSCFRGAATWQPLDPALPAGGIPLARLSFVETLGCN